MLLYINTYAIKKLLLFIHLKKDVFRIISSFNIFASMIIVHFIDSKLVIRPREKHSFSLCSINKFKKKATTFFKWNKKMYILFIFVVATCNYKFILIIERKFMYMMLIFCLFFLFSFFPYIYSRFTDVWSDNI